MSPPPTSPDIIPLSEVDNYWQGVIDDMRAYNSSLVPKGLVGKAHILVQFEGEWGLYSTATQWEIRCLTRLYDNIHTPNLLHVSDLGKWCDNTIRSFLPGETVTFANIYLPDYRDQAAELLHSIHDRGVATGDFKTDNMTVHNGRLYFVDFSNGSVDYMNRFAADTKRDWDNWEAIFNE